MPAREIRRLLADKPVAVGLAVPGMPVGSPGMDGPAYGGRKDPFEVLLLGKGGSSKVYQRYAGTKVMRNHLIAAALVLVAASAFAQSPQAVAPGQAAQAGHAPTASADFSEGEVRKVDRPAGKITLRHGEIRNLDMPPMTMVFGVSDAAMLDRVKPGDKVRFKAVDRSGKLTRDRAAADPRAAAGRGSGLTLPPSEGRD